MSAPRSQGAGGVAGTVEVGCLLELARQPVRRVEVARNASAVAVAERNSEVERLRDVFMWALVSGMSPRIEGYYTVEWVLSGFGGGEV